MNILLIGSGGREHSLAWAVSRSPLTKKLYVAPGNAGIASIAETVQLDAADHAAIIRFCKDRNIDFVIVGPEAPLVAGLVDDLAAAGIKAFGPGKQAAQLEGSKGYTKDLCARANIPTAAYRRFTAAEPAKDYIASLGAPIVVKADGLAAGKGVIIAMTVEEAYAAVDACFSGSFGQAGAEVVVEEFLQGEEASFFVLVDGKTALPLATAQDHKRAFDGDQGPNTGGMGAYSPAPVMSEQMIERAMREIIHPTVATMAAEGTPFKGVLYAGLMITQKGPELIEYNTRFGDPECQVLMMRLQDDILPLLIASAEGTLDQLSAAWSDDVVLSVVMAAKGYPADYAKGSQIKGLEEAAQDPDVEIFHAGTRLSETGDILANGGRVLNVTARGASVAQARERAYAAIEKIDWPEGFCRKDIGWRAMERDG